MQDTKSRIYLAVQELRRLERSLGHENKRSFFGGLAKAVPRGFVSQLV